MEENKLPVSRMSIWESVFAIGWIPVHMLGLPALLLVRLFPGLSAANLNFGIYVIGTLVLSLLCLGFLRRDFDRVWERPLFVLGQAALGCLILLAICYAVSVLLRPFLPETNPNNQALVSMARSARARMTVTILVLAPLVEELMFRGGVFGLLRRWSRAAAYAVSMLLFALPHVLSYAVEDPSYWPLLLQYLAAGFLLCRSYEKTECIWTSIVLHMLNNGVTLLTLL